ncbi:glycosyltransferase [Flavobacterium sp. LHD-85]|uniref:glycosyltransferase family 2 protein n=1 Tax=Flavobacterium sp. LHD-85 TaxID=3071410 RepID=UPI0027E0C21B|nr:glycosyltransferase [Flavobacterium sp. LHD-85]MDQ6529621.1 glycosyltransferase [Flavobacterium sp. LHD-85]
MQLSVVILSYTTTEGLFNMTSNCITSLIESEKDIDLEIILVESNKNYNESGFIYPEFVKVIVPDSDFNFHKFLNIGIKEAKGQFVALCNNDLIFYKNWFSAIRRISQNNKRVKSFSPSGNINDMSFVNEFELGYKVRTHIQGWCLVIYKDVLKRIGYLDETFNFGYADNDYAMTLKKYNIKHALVNSSKVEHLEREKVKKNRENLSEGYKKLLENVDLDTSKLPSYVLTEGNKYLLEDKKVLDDYVKYHTKWGAPNFLYRKNKIADLLISFNLGFLNRIIL